jgi:hypothetical protein
LETVWIVQSARTPQELRDHLEEYIGAGDQLLILASPETRQRGLVSAIGAANGW